MMIPVSSPAVLGRLREFCKPYDFVLAPVVRDGDFNLDEEASKPILVTRFAKDSEEWSTATYFNVRTGYRKIRVLLNGEGWQVGKYLVCRLYQEEGLALKKRPQAGGRLNEIGRNDS